MKIFSRTPMGRRALARTARIRLIATGPRGLCTVILSLVLAGAASADGTTTPASAIKSASATTSMKPAKPVDPLTKLCAKIGRPATAAEVQALSHYVVTGFSTPYKEVIGTFKSGRTRSTRYLPDGKRTAQFITIKGRKLCLTSPGSTGTTCGVPLVCKSAEADYVMVDANQAPFVRISKAKPRPANAPPLAKDADWVKFAGGTSTMTMPSGPVGNGGLTPATNITVGNKCAVGAGYGPLDSAYAYYWTGPCKSGYASGDHRVVYVTQSGNVHALELGPGVGMETVNGKLIWSFPDTPVPISVECQTADDKTIPTSADQVGRIDVKLTVPYSVDSGNSYVFGKLVKQANTYVRQICGRAPIPGAGNTEYAIHGAGSTPEEDVRLYWSDSGPEWSDNTSPALRAQRSMDQSRTYEGRRAFAQYLRRAAEAQRLQAVKSALASRSLLPNIANGVRSARIETLVALVDGVLTEMPWKSMSPTYSNGEFRVDWSLYSTDPLAFYLPTAMTSQTGWREIVSLAPSQGGYVQLALTCFVRASDARKLAATNWVDVVGRLLNYSNGRMTLQCSAP